MIWELRRGGESDAAAVQCILCCANYGPKYGLFTEIVDRARNERAIP